MGPLSNKNLLWSGSAITGGLNGVVHPIEFGRVELQPFRNELSSRKRPLGDSVSGMRLSFREHVIELVGEHAGQRTAEKHVGSLIVATPHGGAQRRSHFVACDFAERQHAAIRTICKRERASLII